MNGVNKALFLMIDTNTKQKYRGIHWEKNRNESVYIFLVSSIDRVRTDLTEEIS